MVVLSRPSHATLLAYEGFRISFPTYGTGGTGFAAAPWTGSGYTLRAKSLCFARLDASEGGSVAGEAVNQVTAQIEDLGVQEENARIELEDAPDISHLDNRLRDQQAVVATDRGLLAEARARYEGLSRETEARKRRVAAIAALRLPRCVGCGPAAVCPRPG